MGIEKYVGVINFVIKTGFRLISNYSKKFKVEATHKTRTYHGLKLQNIRDSCQNLLNLNRLVGASFTNDIPPIVYKCVGVHILGFKKLLA